MIAAKSAPTEKNAGAKRRKQRWRARPPGLPELRPQGAGIDPGIL